MGRSRRAAALLASLAIALVACSSAPEVELYNNAPGDVVVTVRGMFVDAKALWIEPGTPASFLHPPADEALRICLDGAALEYALPHPPPGYYVTEPLLWELRAQINADGRIWILKPGEHFLLSDTAVQPAPFPVVPKRVGSCD